MLKIGLTGGIGSGKSTVAKIFEVLGVPVYYADDASKRLMNEHPGLMAQIKQHFGDEAYVKGELNRAYLSSVVFNSPDLLQLLNSIVHPITIKDAEEWMQRQTGAYAIKEAALIFESGAQAQLDKVIGVYAPAAVRIHRVMQRDAVDRNAVLARISKQVDESIKMKLCDYVVVNDEQQLLVPQVLQLHEKLSQLATATI